jgi:hypothetical protein
LQRFCFDYISKHLVLQRPLQNIINIASSVCIIPTPKGKLQNIINPENQNIITFLTYLYKISYVLVKANALYRARHLRNHCLAATALR